MFPTNASFYPPSPIINREIGCKDAAVARLIRRADSPRTAVGVGGDTALPGLGCRNQIRSGIAEA
jgi:hypothetical protein